MNVDASIVVPSYRGAGRLPVLLDALRHQDFMGAWELLVVLDGVVDDSPAVLEALRGDLPLTVIELPENRGRPAALNAGFDAAKGRVLIRCDDDLEPAADYLSAHVRAHVTSPDRGVIGLYLNVLPDTPYARVYGAPADARIRDEAYATPSPERWHYWAGNCSVTRSTYDAVGGYDETFRGYGWEDVDWGFRLHQTGRVVELHPELETRHHAANVTTGIRVRRAYASGAARARFDRKHRLTEPAPHVSGLKARAWNGAVAGLAALRSRNIIDWNARATDRVLGRLPGPSAAKIVALQVEAAARAGYRRGMAEDSAPGAPARG